MTIRCHERVKQAWISNGQRIDSWSLHLDKFSHSGRKIVALRQVVGSYEGTQCQKSLQDACESKFGFLKRYAAQSAGSFRMLYFQNMSRLIVHMGRNSTLENVGLAFERTSGLPIVPGSSLKGVVSNWSIWDRNGEITFNKPKEMKIIRSDLDPDLSLLFGDNSDSENSAGCVTFFGLFPLSVPALELDILTPHQGRVLPNPFLTVDKGYYWMCPIFYRGEMEDANRMLDLAQSLIVDCLSNYGVGAKVAAGYGRMKRLDEKLPPFSDYLSSLQGRLDQLEISIAQAREQDRLLLAEAEKKRIQEAENRRLEEVRRALLSPEQVQAEEYEKTLRASDIAGDLKGRMRKISELPVQAQLSICILLRDKYTDLWKADVIAASKAEKRDARKRDRDKSFIRVQAVRSVSEKLGVRLP